MSTDAQALVDAALTLSDAERAEIVVELLSSLDGPGDEVDPAELDRRWAEETERRARQIASGAVQTETWDDVLRRVADARRTR